MKCLFSHPYRLNAGDRLLHECHRLVDFCLHGVAEDTCQVLTAEQFTSNKKLNKLLIKQFNI